MKNRKLELFFATCMLIGVLAAGPRAQSDGFWGWAWDGILHVVDAASDAFGGMVNGMFGVGTTPSAGGYGGGGGGGYPE